MTQTNIFDFVEAKRLKDMGMAQAASNRKELLKEEPTQSTMLCILARIALARRMMWHG